jgi:hypothetical protein
MIKNTEKILVRINQIKAELLEILEMRPGTLTEQYYKRGSKKWPYWQLSYTHKKKSRTEYIRDDFVKQIKKEVQEYARFKQLTTDWVDLSIILSKLKLEAAKKLLDK